MIKDYSKMPRSSPKAKQITELQSGVMGMLCPAAYPLALCSVVYYKIVYLYCKLSYSKNRGILNLIKSSGQIIFKRIIKVIIVIVKDYRVFRKM